ncbi:MAG: aminopeptidase P family protein [bacterium]|nr:aminopeptidase P family protein [bacterium]
MNSVRLFKLREEVNKVDAFLITELPSIRYLINFTGSSGVLLVTQEEAIFFTDFRYKEQSEREVKGAETVIVKESLLELAHHPIIKSLKKIGFEQEIRYSTYWKLKNELKNKRLVPLKDKVERLRMLKDIDEITNIRKAANIADSAFKDVKSTIKPGVKEKDIAIELEYQLKKRGASGTPFDTIVASGPNAALPHARAGNRKLRDRDTVIIDFGAVYNGYASDMTRTLILGNNQKANKIYRLVLDAQLTAISNVKHGISLKKLDRIARDVITKAGYGKCFGHSLGHGVGLEVHEAPRVSSNSEDYAQVGMVFTIEPAVYIKDFGGVRIEDMVVVKDSGVKVITHSPK